MKRHLLLLMLTLALTGLAAVALAQGPEPTRPWQTPAQAGTFYWLLVALTLLGLLAFTFWALYGRARPRRWTTAGYHALGALVVVMTLFTLVLYVIPATQAERIPPTDRAWDWQPGEVLKDPGGSGLTGEPYRGYLVYLANGCTYCHTLYLRPQDIETGWGEGARPEDVSQIGDFVHYPFTLLGTQRDGPDLSLIGRRIPDMTYHIEHLKDPRAFRARSIMPSYRYLSERDLWDLAAFLVSLGNDPDDLRAGRVGPPTRPGLSELAKRGQQLYRQLGCVGCHTVDGSPSTGPTWKGLYGKAREVTLPDGTTQTVIADEAYLKESIVQPKAKVVKGFPAIMPAYPQLSGEELSALIEYIESLK
jgi:cbb3-type cytochrome oxidase cytochrome c subunit